MKYITKVFFLMSFFWGVASQVNADAALNYEKDFMDLMWGERGLDLHRYKGKLHSVFSKIDFNLEPISNQNPDASASLSDYETFIPDNPPQEISIFERAILNAYMENPDDIDITKLLAAYHLKKALSNKHRGSAKSLKHYIYANYFLNRVLDAGDGAMWVAMAARKTERALLRFSKPKRNPVVEEDLDAHLFFIDAFNNNAVNRHLAVDGLLEAYVAQPENLVTNAYITSSSIWVGGEAPYNDSTILYSFLLSSYFSLQSVKMAEVVERAWLADPDNNPQFRLSSILGGWTVPARRWLALFHGDALAVLALDEEHRQWLAINRAFHSASVGLMMFNEPENMMEGFLAWLEGFRHCEDIPEMRSCIDRPKLTFNRLGFVLGGIDYFLRIADIETAQFFLNFRWVEGFGYSFWDLGREGWEHREII